MSFTTVDIAGSLKDVVREEGSLTRDVIREGLEGLGRQIELQIDALGKRMEERDKRMEERDKRMDERLGQMSASIESISASIESISADIKSMSEDNRAFFRQMLDARNIILKKVS